MSFEDFMKLFAPHIDGTASNERDAVDSADEDDKAHKSAKPGTLSKKGTDPNKTASSHMVDEMDS